MVGCLTLLYYHKVYARAVLCQHYYLYFLLKYSRHNIKPNTNLQGIEIKTKLSSTVITNLQYADDIVVAVSDDRNALPMFDEVKQFSNVAGPK
jgi:hypothetical protein